MAEIKTKLGNGGRIVIPARYREKMGARVGDELVLVLEGPTVRVLTPREAVRRAQSLVRRYARPEKSLSEDLLEERRQERDG